MNALIPLITTPPPPPNRSAAPSVDYLEDDDTFEYLSGDVLGDYLSE